MLAAMTNASGGETYSKLVWWILGILGALGFTVAAFNINKLERIDSRMNTLEVTLSGLTAKINQAESLASSVRQEQMDRTTKFGEINTRLTLGERSQSTIEQRINNINETLSTINRRLDRLLPADRTPLP